MSSPHRNNDENLYARSKWRTAARVLHSSQLESWRTKSNVMAEPNSGGRWSQEQIKIKIVFEFRILNVVSCAKWSSGMSLVSRFLNRFWVESLNGRLATMHASDSSISFIRTERNSTSARCSDAIFYDAILMHSNCVWVDCAGSRQRIWFILYMRDPD